MATLTNEFYHLVPVGGFEYDAIRPIRDKKVLKEHFRLVSDLMDMEVASKILLGTQRKLPGMPPLFACLCVSVCVCESVSVCVSVGL